MCVGVVCANCLGGREHKTSTAPPALCSELSCSNMKKPRLQTAGCQFSMLRTALFACLMLSPWHLSLWGPDCRSWSIASRGTTCRSLLNSALNLGFNFVVQGNLMASRLGLVNHCFDSMSLLLCRACARLVLCLLCVLSVHGFYIVEQPRLRCSVTVYGCTGLCVQKFFYSELCEANSLVRILPLEVV